MPEQQPAITITTNDGDTSISTPYQQGWNVADWLTVHYGDVNESTQPAYDTLETHWLTANGRVSHETGRNPGESDEDFKDRHFADVLDRMGTDVPITS